jgi:hypothetical protein
MLTILNGAQALVYTLMDLMPSKYQQKSLRALLGLFLEAIGQSLPQHSQTVSASAISRFLNHYQWSVRGVIRVVRTEIIRQVQAEKRSGRRPILTVILDMTTLEKIGKFSGLGELIRVYNSKRGLHLLVLYILVGRSRVPWGFRVDRGKGELTPVKLGQRLLKTLPKTLTAHYEIRVLGDSAFGSIEMLKVGGLSVDSIIFYCLLSRLLDISSIGENHLTRLGKRGATGERNFVGIFGSFGAVN